MDFFSLLPFGSHGKRKTKKKPSPRSPGNEQRLHRPGLEALEDRSLPSCNTISGYVFSDVNNNGIFDSGETPIAGSALELHDSTGKVVGTATSAANGYYEFTYDSSINTQPATLEQTVSIPTTLAGFSLDRAIDQFDPELGELQSVEIINQGAITSAIRAENYSTLVGATITGNVSGSITLTGPGNVKLTSNVSQNAGTFDATPFDGTIDFGGSSGKKLDPQTATASAKSIVLTGADMQAFIGTGQINFNEKVEVNSTASGGGNLLLGIDSSATATFVVRYKYIPRNCLKPGDYTIIQKEQPPLQPGSPQRYLDGKDSSNGVTLPGSVGKDEIHVTLDHSNLPNNNFGEVAPASLAGYVFSDDNNDGSKQAGETGIANAIITLTGTDDLGQAVSLTALTDASGFYKFDNLRPGTYSLSETQPANYLDGKDAVGSQGGTLGNDKITGIGLTAGTNGINNNFGEIKAGSLSGYVYQDVNNDGVKQAGESGIGGVTVRLVGTDDQGDVTLLTTTAADGSYSFTNLRPGTYTIAEEQPANYLDGKDTIGSQGGSVSDDHLSNIVLNNGGQGINNNFGELLPAALGGFVYHDANNNGVMDLSEQGIAGASLTLTGTDDRGAVSRTLTTGADGSYNFDNLRPGTYTIKETQPTGYLDGRDTAGTPGGFVTDDQISAIALSQGFRGSNNNFGELLPGSLSGHVFNDRNDNGIMDSGEPGLAGVTVKLTGSDDRGAVNLTTITDSTGAYKFDNLRPGTYTITETQPPGFDDGKDSLGNLGGVLGNDVFSNVVLPEAGQGSHYDFGEKAITSLSGYVYHDVNNNGIKDPGEEGIAGVRVDLLHYSDVGVMAISTTTDANGAYRFDHLLPGTYVIKETQPSNFLDGKDTIGSLGGTVSDDQFSGISLAELQTGTNYNFGELKASSLSGFVYEDGNNDGVKDPGEAGIAGVALTLTGTTDKGAITRTTTTAADGSYIFDNLPPGTYVITETQPSGYADGKDTIGTPGGTVGNDTFTNIVLAENTNGTNNNFGERIAGDVGVTKSASAANVLAGGQVTYTITVTNHGPSTARGIHLEDVLPAGEVFVSTDAPGWTFTQADTKLIFERDSLAVGESVVIKVVVQAPIDPGSYLNTVEVRTATVDLDPSNNTDHATVTVKTAISPNPPETNPPSQNLSKNMLLLSSDFWLAWLNARF